MKVSMCFRIVLAGFCLLFITGLAAAEMGLEVGPDNLKVTGVPLGRKTAISELSSRRLKLEIKNKSSAAYNYEIKIVPSEDTTAPLPAGYSDIPDTGWITAEKKEVKIEAGRAKEVELYIDIPKKEEYAGKKYQAVIEVKSKKNDRRDLFVLAAQVRIRFETGAKAQKPEECSSCRDK
ncbi:MAG: DUF916 domain-containing protein [Candidatus Omnitrophica bacterium]|nr:DUF916 domain-containing protein [Candidatus Omnitrophota bacterium]